MHINRKGFTLVELMVVLVILAVIVVGVFGVIITQNKAYHSEEGIIDMQANAQIALQRISRLVRMTGFGCKDNISSTNQIYVDTTTSFSTVITATNNSTSPDSLTVVMGLTRVGVVDNDNDPTNGSYPTNTSTATVPIVRDPNIDPLSTLFDTSTSSYKHYFYISPADNNDFLSVSAIGTSFLTKTVDNITVNEGDVVYTVRPYTIRLYTDAQGISCLGIDDGSGIDSCAENIEDLQFQYGWDADNSGAIDTAEWVDDPTGNEDKVKSIQVFILGRTANPDRDFIDLHDDNATIAKKQYTIADHTITLDDDENNGFDSPFDQHFHRYLLETTIMVRNLNF